MAKGLCLIAHLSYRMTGSRIGRNGPNRIRRPVDEGSAVGAKDRSDWVSDLLTQRLLGLLVLLLQRLAKKVSRADLGGPHSPHATIRHHDNEATIDEGRDDLSAPSWGASDPPGQLAHRRGVDLVKENQDLPLAGAECRHDARPRARRMSRRSRSDLPPQIPNFSRFVSAYSRHSLRTTQPRQTRFGGPVGLPRSMKKSAGSRPRQAAS